MANGKNGVRPKFHHINTPLRRHGGIPFINFINFLRRLAKNLPCHSARLVFNKIGIHRIMLNSKKDHSSLIVVTFKHDFLVIHFFPWFWHVLLFYVQLQYTAIYFICSMAIESFIVAIFKSQLHLSYMESLIFKFIVFTVSSFSFLREDFQKEFQEQNLDVKSRRDVCVESILLEFLLIYFILLIAQEEGLLHS